MALAACGGGSNDAPSAAAPTVATIALLPADAVGRIGIGQSLTLTAEARDPTGAVTGADFTWASSNSAVAVVAGGIVTGVAAGTTVITASSGGVTSNAATITVAASASISRIVIDKAAVWLPASGQTVQLSAQIVDAQGGASAVAAQWTTSAPDKVAVDANGGVVALAIGSALVTAEVGGVRSAPTLVLVAEPRPGALLVTDAQVVSVGPLLLAAGELPGVGSLHDVTLQGVTAPAVGSVLLALETAPIAGTVVSTRQDASGLIVRLAIAPLHKLFETYDIALKIDLSSFATEALPVRSAQAAPAARATSLAGRWNAERDARRQILGTARALDVLAPFKAFDCDASLKPQLVGAPVSLTVDNKLSLVLVDRPGYSKHALEGSATLVGAASLKLKAGFKAAGRCDAQAQLKFPIFGWFSALVMPAVRFGLGAELEGEVLLVQSDLGVEGQIGFSPVLGWECGGATPACRGLDTITTVNEFKTKSTFPSEYGMQAKVSGHFYVVAGLDAALLAGAFNAGIVEARVGPKQSFDLAFEKAQAARPDYAASYDLKFEGVVEPGAALSKAIEAVIDDDWTTVKFKAEASQDISESPKGSHTVSTTKARPGEAVDFKVKFDPAASVNYFVIGYNVLGVELYRRAEGEVDFTPWKSMQLTASGSDEATYRWIPGPADGGKYEFAAFVNTEILTPLLEVGKDTIRSVEVSCFAASTQSSNDATRRSALAAQPRGSNAIPLASTCADTWVGTTATGDAAYGPNLTQATLTLRLAPWIDTGSPTIVAYYAEGTVKVKHNDLPGCTTTPTEFAFDSSTGREGGRPLESNQWFVDYSTNPPTVHGGGEVSATVTTVCPTFTTTSLRAFSFGHVPPGTVLSPDGLSFSGSNPPFYAFEFRRP
ncbi:MAG: Ig-like domain-containing protein [Rubrivivax sp.]